MSEDAPPAGDADLTRPPVPSDEPGEHIGPYRLLHYAHQLHRVPSPPAVTHINLILNWFEELKAKVPTGR